MLVIRVSDPTPSNAVLLPIRGGLKTLISPEDFTAVNAFKWFPLKSAHSTYVCTRKIIKGKSHTIRMHRFITKAPSFMKVHHINHNTFDNRRENLKLVTEREHRHFDGWHIFYRPRLR